MALKPDSSFASEERTFSEETLDLLREILGILIGLVALLIFLSLLSERQDARWIGPIGEWIAVSLDFAFGHYVSFVLPAMLAICAWHALRGLSIAPWRGRGWLRGLGGLLIIISTCALLTLSTLARGEAEPTRAFAMGGVVGNLLIDAEGANLAALLGHVGTAVLFGALALIGLVLFTETMLRDLATLGWGGVRRVGRGGAGPLRRLAAWHVLLPGWWGRRLLGPIADAGGRLAGFHPLERLTGGLRLISFRRPERARIAGPGPIIELVRAEDARREAAHGAEAEPEDPIEAAAIASRRRGLSVFPRAAAGRGANDAGGGEPRPISALTPPAEDEEASVAPEPRSSGVLARRAAQRESVAVEQHHGPDHDLERLARARVKAEQPEMDLFPSEYQLPSLDLLTDPPAVEYEMSEEEQTRLSQRIEQTLAQFKVEVNVVEVIQGPVITRFALKVAPGVRVSKIISLESELAMALKAPHVRILAPIPGQAAVGIEVPNRKSNPVMLKELLASEAFKTSKSPLSFALGKNIAGEPIVCDLAKMPHLLIAGATGSGKSVCLNAIIASLLYRNKPDQVKFVMVDPKRVELSIYQAIPHLIAPVVSETKKAAAALAWCVEQMEKRYKLLAELGLRNIDGYNALVRDPTTNKRAYGRSDLHYMPHVVIIIDELADLMVVAKNEVEEYIIRLAQMARAVGMHLVLATQRPSVNVITGIIKANFPSRIAFQVSSKVDSRTILDMNGAEALLGRGDMLYSPGGAKPFRIQGCFVADAEVERLADFIREQEKARYEKEDFEARPTPAERAKAQLRVEEADEAPEMEEAGGELDELAVAGRAGAAPLTPADMEQLSDEELYDMALRLILESRKASVSYIQRRMKIGYARAGRIMDILEEQGIVGPYQGSKPRDLLIDPVEYLQRLREAGAED
ncbi:MAG: DNA translocase SpoIIIE [candidate division BRC1 bacterium ADurb.BinA292]|nr:MAG: DNA translocase SpoIIIE [candidate division BRC1 bacterium ADurb.BinA292]